MPEDEVEKALQEERAYSGQLTLKVQEQAKELKRQADELEWAAECRDEYTRRLQEVDPGYCRKKLTDRKLASSPVRDVLKPDTNPAYVVSALARQRSGFVEAQLQINKLEKQLRDGQRKSMEANRQNHELRKLLDKHRRGYSAARLQADRLSEQLVSEVEARKDAEEHARLLEISFERSGKGMAMMKAAKYEADLEKAHQQIRLLEEKLHKKDDAGLWIMAAPEEHVSGCQEGVANHQSGVAGQEQELTMYNSSHDDYCMTIHNGKEMEEKKLLMEKIAVLSEKEEHLLALNEQLKTQVEEDAADKAALLSFVQELQDEHNDLKRKLELSVHCETPPAETSDSKSKDHQIKVLKDLLQETQNELGQQKAQLLTLDTRNGIIEKEIHALRLSKSRTHDNLHEACMRAKMLKDENERLQKEVEDMESENESLQKSWEEKQQLLTKVESELVDSDRRLNASQQEIRQLQQVESTNNELRSREAALLELVEELRSSKEDLRMSAQERDEQAAWLSKIQQHFASISSLHNQVQSCDERDAAKEDEPWAWVDNMLKQLSRDQVAWESLSSAQEAQKGTNMALEEIRNQYKELKRKHEDTIQSRDNLLEKVEKLMSQVEELHGIRSQYELAQMEIRRLEATKSDLENIEGTGSIERSDLLYEVEELRKQRDKGEEALSIVREQQSTMARKVDELQNKILQSEVQSTASAADNLEHVEDARGHVQELQKQLHNARSERDHLAGQLEECQRCRQCLEHQVEENENEKENMTVSIERLLAANEGCKGEMSELRKQLEHHMVTNVKLEHLLSRIPLDQQEPVSSKEDSLVARLHVLVEGTLNMKSPSGAGDGGQMDEEISMQPNRANDPSLTLLEASKSQNECDFSSRPSTLGERMDKPQNISCQTRGTCSKQNKHKGNNKQVQGTTCVSTTAWTDLEAKTPAKMADSDKPPLDAKSKGQQISNRPRIKAQILDDELERQMVVSDSVIPHPIRDNKAPLLQNQLKELHSSFRTMRSKYK